MRPQPDFIHEFVRDNKEGRFPKRPFYGILLAVGKPPLLVMTDEQLRFFNPYAGIRHTENRLPHWQQKGAVYFVTFRLADAIPSNLLKQWETERELWLRFHPEPWSQDAEQEYHRRFSGTIERWLDAGHGSCVLRESKHAELVANALQYFDGKRCAQIAWVVMPNHVHTLFVQYAEWPLERLIHSWKLFTARRINKRVGRLGSLWQRDYFDRLVRDQIHLSNCVRYIRHNPGKAQLRGGEYVLYENDLAKSIE
jgi:putative transposase